MCLTVSVWQDKRMRKFMFIHVHAPFMFMREWSCLDPTWLCAHECEFVGFYLSYSVETMVVWLYGFLAKRNYSWIRSPLFATTAWSISSNTKLLPSSFTERGNQNDNRRKAQNRKGSLERTSFLVAKYCLLQEAFWAPCLQHPCEKILLLFLE